MNWLILGVGIYIFLVVISRITKPEQIFKDIIKDLDEKIKKSENRISELNSRKKQEGTQSKESLVSENNEFIEKCEKNKYHFLHIRNGYAYQCEKYRHIDSKLKQIKIDWSNYVHLIRNKTQNFHGYDDEKLEEIRVLEIEKRITEGFTDKEVKPKSEDEKKKLEEEIRGWFKDFL